MARRPTRSLNLNLRQLTYNPSTGLYDAEENGIFYHLDFEQMNHLKNFYSGSQAFKPTYMNWFNHLDRFQKQKVKRSGNVPIQPNNFYPDNEPEY